MQTTDSTSTEQNNVEQEESVLNAAPVNATAVHSPMPNPAVQLLSKSPTYSADASPVSTIAYNPTELASSNSGAQLNISDTTTTINNCVPKYTCHFCSKKTKTGKRSRCSDQNCEGSKPQHIAGIEKHSKPTSIFKNDDNPSKKQKQNSSDVHKPEITFKEKIRFLREQINMQNSPIHEVISQGNTIFGCNFTSLLDVTDYVYDILECDTTPSPQPPSSHLSPLPDDG